MKNLYFISDAHLAFKETALEKEKREKLEQFLLHILEDTNAGGLYLVGDIFDFWFEWYHVVPRYWFKILFRLRQLVEAGIEVNFITGNHDFYFNKYLQEEVGLNCYHENHTFQTGDKKWFVAHGDGYAKKDRGYRFLKRIIRHPLSIFLYKTFISADLGMQIASMFSKSSRQLVRIEKTAWAEEYYKYALEKFNEGFHNIVLGHIHYPMCRRHEEKTYVSCGDWITRFNYGFYDGHTLTLRQWPEQDVIVN